MVVCVVVVAVVVVAVVVEVPFSYSWHCWLLTWNEKPTHHVVLVHLSAQSIGVTSEGNVRNFEASIAICGSVASSKFAMGVSTHLYGAVVGAAVARTEHARNFPGHFPVHSPVCLLTGVRHSPLFGCLQ